MSEMQEAVTEEMEADVIPTEGVSEEAVERLADDFLVLQQEVLELGGIGDVPEEVLCAAAEKHIPLLDAYLRHCWQEQRAIREEQARRERVAECSTGSLHTDGKQTSPVAGAFARAFAQALQ